MLTDNQKKALDATKKRIENVIKSLDDVEALHYKDEALMAVIVGHKLNATLLLETVTILLS